MKEVTMGQDGDFPQRRARRQISEGTGDAPRVPKPIIEKKVGGTLPREGSQSKADTLENPHEGTTLEQRHPDWPKVNLTVCFSYHSSAEDAEKARESMAGKHIYLYESPGGRFTRIPLDQITDEGYADEQFASDIANNSLGNTPMDHSFFGPILRTLHKSGIVVGHADLQETERELYDRLDEAIGRPYQERSLSRTENNFVRKWEDIVAGEEERDTIIVDRIEEELGNIFALNPELQGKESVDVLFTIGIHHRKSLEKKFLAKGIAMTEVVDGYDDLYTTKIQEELSNGHGISRELFLRGYIESFFAENLAFAQRRSDTYEYANRVVSQFSVTELYWFHDFYYMEGGVDVNKFLSRKGLPPFPHTDEELRESIAICRERAANAEHSK